MTRDRDVIRNLGAYFYRDVFGMLIGVAFAGFTLGYLLCAVVTAVLP